MLRVWREGSQSRAGTWAAPSLALTLALSLAGCAQQRIRDDAQARTRAGDYEAAVAGLKAGLQSYPDSAILRAGLVETQADAITRLATNAAAARAAGKLDEAEQLLQRGLALDPGNTRLQALLEEASLERRQRAALSEAESLAQQRKPAAALKVLSEALKGNSRHPELLALQRRIELEQRQAQVQAARLGLAETRPISLDFRDAPLRTVLDVVSRNSGINFIIDKDVRPDVRVTVFLRSAPVEDAIDLIASTYQLSKKLVDSQTVLIYPNTPEKQREHQEQVIRVFYMASAEAKGAASFLKSMLKLRDPYVDERSNMLALRDSQEVIQIAERLLALYDSNEPEVLLEVEVIEVRTSRLTELGVRFPDAFTLTALPPAGETGLTLDNVRGLTRDRIGLNVGGITVNLRRETGDFNILANPRVRVRNKEKAKILIGDKVPVITTTTGTGGFVSDSVSYIDVGLKLDVEPTVYVDNEVAMRVALEVSSLSSQITTRSGSLAYQIGTRNASTLLRLRDGETQLLAGLINTQDRGDATRVPGLGDLPMLGRLFASHRDQRDRTELVLSITPRVVRNLRRLDASESELWVGTDAVPRLRPVAGMTATLDDTGAVKGQMPGAATLSGALSATSPQPTAAPASPAVLQWTGPSEVKPGDTFVVTLSGKTTVGLRGMPIEIGFDKERLALMEIAEGDFFRQGGTETSFTRSFDAEAGRARAGVLRNTPTGASGQGNILTLRLKALKAGTAELAVIGAEPIGVAGPAPVSSALPVLRIKVQ